VNDINKYWEQALEIIAAKIDRTPFQTWFKSTSGAYDGEIFIVDCPTAFAKEWIYSRYANVVLAAIEQATGNSAVKIAFRSVQEKPEPINKDRVSILY